MAKTRTGTRTGTTTGSETKTKWRQLPIGVAEAIDKSDQEIIDEIGKKLEENPTLEIKPEPGDSDEPVENDPLPREPNPTEGEAPGEGDEKTDESDDTREPPEFNDDEGPDDYSSGTGNGIDSTPFEQPELPSLGEYLQSQLGELTLSDREKIIAETIIGSLNDKGLLEDSLTSIAQTLNEEHGYGAFDAEADVEPVLKKIQQLDPPGIGARDVRECFIIQLERYRHEPEAELLRRIITNDYDGFLKIGDTPGQRGRLCKKFGITTEDLKIALQSYRLSTRPAAGFASGKDEVPIIDFEVHVDDENITVEALNRIPELQITAVAGSNDKAFDKLYVQPAKNFMEILRQRQQVLLRTITAVVNAQRDFFLSGDRNDLHPLTLKDIADRVGIHPSGVSRVTSKRRVQTPFGIIRLKDLFIGAIGESTREKVMSKIQQIVDGEDPKAPLSDDKIAEILASQGFPIARRTVAKYRQELGIPNCDMRQEQ